VKFNNLFVSRELRFALGIEEESGRCYLSIPVSNTLTDYDEYYEIDRATLDRFLQDPPSAVDILARCRNRELDELLILKPGSDRGEPW
jgi:hypothetical protein